MTWKSAAVGVGASALATYLASTTPVRPIDRAAPRPEPSAARTEAAAADIQQLADRLHVRMYSVPSYHQPTRNPFRFSARTASAPRSQPAEPTITVEPMIAAAPVQPTLRLALSGIAENKVGDQVERTAIISTTGDVLMVKEGEEIAGLYKVVKIGLDSVELARISDGTVVRLALRP